jgi:uncharacterized membrane protein YgdD (TMEM256/DUF423 family)
MRLLEPIAALSAALAIAAGAFGAHAATGLAAELLRTASQYQLVHAVAVPAVLALGGRRGAAMLLLAGSLLFALSLDGLALGAPRWTGAITPLGGLAMIAGWLWLALGWSRDRL